MSVLIKNMGTPTNCGECMAFVCYRQYAGDSGDCFCGITKKDAKADVKNTDCPLVPIPPHGRLIDADELTYHKWPVGENLYGRGWNDAIDTICENAEIVIEEEDMSYNTIYERLMSASENNDYSKYLRDLLREAASSIGNMEEIIKSLAPTIFTPED